MSEKPKKITPKSVLEGESPLILTATLQPVAGDRFQPAGFPEIGHVIYKAPRKDGSIENVCIVDSAASMANHLESVCMRGAHDFDLVDDLAGMPYIRCVTGEVKGGQLPPESREVVVTSLTEGHRIASTYFLEGEHLRGNTLQEEAIKKVRSVAQAAKERAKKLEGDEKKKAEKEAKEKDSEVKELEDQSKFQALLIREFGVALAGSSKAHPPSESWWNVFSTIFDLDPNSLVHGVLFPQWQIKIPRFLTAHLEAFGAGRVDRSGVKFDRLGKTTSGQPIFAVDDATAEAIRATFILDVGLIKSFGRKNKDDEPLGLTNEQKEFLVALALWKIKRLLASPFRFRSGCHLRCVAIVNGDNDVELDSPIIQAIKSAKFREGSAKNTPVITDVYWPHEELYREGQPESGGDTDGSDEESLEGDN